MIGSLLSVVDVANILSLAPRTIYKPDWQRRARLEPVRVGRALRFHAEDIGRLIARRRVDDHTDVGGASLREWARRHGIRWPDADPMKDRG